MDEEVGGRQRPNITRSGRCRSADDLAAVVRVALVVLIGLPRTMEQAVVFALAVCGPDKPACPQSEIHESLAALQAAVGNDYPAFFCGAPITEPTCVPTRPAAVSGGRR